MGWIKNQNKNVSLNIGIGQCCIGIKKHVMLSEDGQTILDHNNSNHALTAARIDALNNHAYSDCSVGTRTAKPWLSRSREIFFQVTVDGAMSYSQSTEYMHASHRLFSARLLGVSSKCRSFWGAGVRWTRSAVLCMYNDAIRCKVRWTSHWIAGIDERTCQHYAWPLKIKIQAHKAK